MANKKKGKVVQMLTPEKYIRQKARTLAIYECWVNDDWGETGMASITVARKHTNGNLTVGLYLVDLKCLGVKDSHYLFNISEMEYEGFLEKQNYSMRLEKAEYTLVHNIIYAGTEYAEDYGFSPHKDFSIAKYILEEDTDEIELIEVDCGGDDGNPLYVKGPLDNAVRVVEIVRQLEKTAGEGNFQVVLDVGD